MSQNKLRIYDKLNSIVPIYLQDKSNEKNKLTLNNDNGVLKKPIKKGGGKKQIMIFI